MLCARACSSVALRFVMSFGLVFAGRVVGCGGC
jgi:hypothetical protein